LEGDSLVVPADVGAEAGDEEWEVDLEAAAAGGDVVACFVDKNGEGEAEAEAPAEERPVDAEEGEEAAQELEAEEQALELEEEGGDGCERAEAFGPAGFFVGGGLGAGVDLGDVIADGLGLGGVGWEPVKGLVPGVAGCSPLLGGFLLGCCLGELAEVVGVEDGVAVGAGEGAGRLPEGAVGAVGDGWRGGDGGGGRDRSLLLPYFRRLFWRWGPAGLGLTC
jgi:hypothetical protein